MTGETNPQSLSSTEPAAENAENLIPESNTSGNCPSSGGTLKQAINKEIENLIQSYIDYAKNVDL